MGEGLVLGSTLRGTAVVEDSRPERLVRVSWGSRHHGMWRTCGGIDPGWQRPLTSQRECVLGQSLQPCLTLWDPVCGLPGPSVHGVPRAGMLEWVAMPSLVGLPSPEMEPASPALSHLESSPAPDRQVVFSSSFERLSA